MADELMTGELFTFRHAGEVAGRIVGRIFQDANMPRPVLIMESAPPPQLSSPPVLVFENPADPAGAIAPAGVSALAAMRACGLSARNVSPSAPLTLTAGMLVALRRYRPVLMRFKGGAA